MEVVFRQYNSNILIKDCFALKKVVVNITGYKSTSPFYLGLKLVGASLVGPLQNLGLEAFRILLPYSNKKSGKESRWGGGPKEHQFSAMMLKYI